MGNITLEEIKSRTLSLNRNNIKFFWETYVDVSTKMKMYCCAKDKHGNDHGEFWICINSFERQRNNTTGCPNCGVERTSNSKRLNTESFIKKAHLVWKDLYDYSEVKYIDSRTKIKVICKKHQEAFMVTPNNHLKNRGCPICKESRRERLISNILKSEHILFKREKTFEDLYISRKQWKLRFDFYIPHLNLLIEYDGKHHFVEDCFIKDLKEVQHRDSIKNEYCLKNNIPLLRLPYTLTEEEIKDKILNALKSTT